MKNNNPVLKKKKKVITSNFFFGVTITVFALSLVLFIIGIISFKDLRESHYFLTNIQLLLTVVVPYTLTLIAFLLQILLYNRDLKTQLKIHEDNYRIMENNSKIFSILERLKIEHEVYAIFLAQIIQRFNEDLDNLSHGKYFERGKSWQYLNKFICQANLVECTSLISPQEWETPEMNQYLVDQENKFDGKHNHLHRTFLFETKDREAIVPYDKILTRQVLKKVHIYFLFKKDYVAQSGDPGWNEIYKDFAFIDRQILIEAKFSTNNVTLEGYEFKFIEDNKIYNSIAKSRIKIEEVDKSLLHSSTTVAIESIKIV